MVLWKVFVAVLSKYCQVAFTVDSKVLLVIELALHALWLALLNEVWQPATHTPFAVEATTKAKRTIQFVNWLREGSSACSTMGEALSTSRSRAQCTMYRSDAVPRGVHAAMATKAKHAIQCTERSLAGLMCTDISLPQ